MPAVILSLQVLAVSCGARDFPADAPGLEIPLNPVPAVSSSYSQHITVVSGKDWAISVEFPDGDKDWAWVSPDSGSPENGDVRLRWCKNESPEPRTAVISVTSGNRTTEYGFVQEGASSGEGGVFKGAGWIELPEILSGDGRDAFHHPMEVGGRTTRNYTFYWNWAARVADWVAYPLNKSLIGSHYGRSEAWDYDPLLPKEKQQDVSGGYKAGNAGRFARGHQIASADRQGNYDRNAPTFYGTNMTPQNFDFNSGIWASLEDAVRGWAYNSDTLYVVTGCVPEGSGKYAVDRSGNHVTVPKAYFKAVIRYSRSSATGYSGYCGLAAYFDHEEYSSADRSGLSFTRDMSMPVSELEDILGYRLFSGLDNVLDASTVAKIKSQDPRAVSWWW